MLRSSTCRGLGAVSEIDSSLVADADNTPTSSVPSDVSELVIVASVDR